MVAFNSLHAYLSVLDGQILIQAQAQAQAQTGTTP